MAYSTEQLAKVLDDVGQQLDGLDVLYVVVVGIANNSATLFKTNQSDAGLADWLQRLSEKLRKGEFAFRA